MRARAPRLVCFAALLAFQIFITQAWGQEAPGRALQIVVVEGEGAINNVRSRVNKEPIVRVEDQNHRPISGAAVIFFLPTNGPGGTFANGTSSYTTTTDALADARRPRRAIQSAGRAHADPRGRLLCRADRERGDQSVQRRGAGGDGEAVPPLPAAE